MWKGCATSTSIVDSLPRDSVQSTDLTTDCSTAVTATSVDRAPSLEPGLATTYEGRDPTLLETVVPLVDYLEIVPDSIAISIGKKRSLSVETLSQLSALPERLSVIAHGVGLSIGSYDAYSSEYLSLLEQLHLAVGLAWHSEHLGYITVDGVNLGTMLPLPRTQESLEMVCRRITEIQGRLGLPFLLENVAHVLPTPEGDYSPAAFLNALVERTGCGLLLDIYNLECDAENHGLDLDAFLAELNLEAVWELHLANGVEHRGLRLDVHSDTTRESTLTVAREVAARAPALRAVTYELLSQAVPVLGYQAIADELRRVREALL